MIHVYIDKNERQVILKNNKQKLIKEYSNISTKNSKDILISIKLLIYSINKIFLLNKRVNDDDYLFHINDEALIKYIKDENYFYEKVRIEWKDDLDDKTYSELGNFLSMFKRIYGKDIIYWVKDELFNLSSEKEALYLKQSECDIKIQDILHEIRNLKEKDVTAEQSVIFVKKLREIGQARIVIKNKIKDIEKQEKGLWNYAE